MFSLSYKLARKLKLVRIFNNVKTDTDLLRGKKPHDDTVKITFALGNQGSKAFDSCHDIYINLVFHFSQNNF